MRTFTGVFREIDTDAPPVYPEPLIYVVQIPDECDSVAVEMVRAAQKIRAEEVDFESELDVLFAFEGDVPTAHDFRA